MREGTYPNNTPPNATNMPMMIAGAADPATSSGFFKAMPMTKDGDLRPDPKFKKTGLGKCLSESLRLQ
jgi:hypothetical protein